MALQQTTLAFVLANTAARVVRSRKSFPTNNILDIGSLADQQRAKQRINIELTSGAVQVRLDESRKAVRRMGNGNDQPALRF